MTVVTLRRPRRTPKPLPIVRESVTAEERVAADNLHRAATALQRLFGTNWATPAALAQAPRLIAEAENALAELKDLIG